MLRAGVFIVALAGCGRFIDEDADLWPPPETGTNVERERPEGFDPCPRLVVEAPYPLSSSAGGTSDPRIAWNQDSHQFMVVWREDELGPDGEVAARRLAFQRLDGAGQPLGVQAFAREPDHSVLETDSDPAVLAVAGLQHAPFIVTVQRGQMLDVDRILDGGDEIVPLNDPLTRALVPSEELARELRIPALSSDGERIAVAYRTVDGYVQLVSLDLDADTGPRCIHLTDDAPPECEDATVGLPGPAAIGWLPPSAASPLLSPYDATGAAPWMAVRVQQTRSLLWLGLRPADDPDDPMVEYSPTPDITGPNDYAAGPRIASANRRFALAVRRDGGTEAWQVANDGNVGCVVAAPALSAGTPAVAWGHGRRLAVAGLVPRGGGTDVYLVRGDAPATQEQRELAVGQPCPEPLEAEQRLTRTEHVRARDPDLAFSGDGFGVVWAQTAGDDPAAEVWFAHARCDDAP